MRRKSPGRSKGRSCLLAGAVLAAVAALLSCPNPIDRALLISVEDEIAPNVTISQPLANSFYKTTITVSGVLEDSSLTEGDHLGSPGSLEVRIPNSPSLNRTVAFAADETYTVSPADSTFSYNPAGGSFGLRISAMALSGPQIISFILTDRNANQTTLTIPLYDDPTGPYIDLASPTSYSTYGLIVNVSGTVTNDESDPSTSDVAGLSLSLVGTGVNIQRSLNLQPGSIHDNGDGTFTHDTATSFTFNSADGSFVDQFLTVGAKGTLTLVVTTADYGGDSSELPVQLIDGGIAPEVGNLVYPQVYSSISTADITVSGTVTKYTDLDPVSGGSFAYTVKEGSTTVVAKDITKDYSDPTSGYSSTTGAFSFYFGVGANGLSGTLTVTILAKDSGGRDSQSLLTISDDPLRPGILSGELAANNSYLDVNFDDAVYSLYSPIGGASGALDAGDLNLLFQPNGSSVTLVTPCPLTSTGGGALQGGEQTIRVNLTYSGGTPTGAETIEIRAVSGSVYDVVGNTALATTTTGVKKLNDQLTPAVQYVDSSMAGGAYKAGSLIYIDVHFGEAVYVTGTPTLLLETGTTDRQAAYQSGSGTNTLTFRYTVQGGDISGDLDYVSAGALAGTIKDAAGNAAVLTLPQPNDPVEISLADNAAIIIDTTPPSVGSVSSLTADGAYKAGSAIYLDVHFSEAVYVTGAPTLLLETGTTDRQAAYQGGQGTNTLSFRYTVQAGDASGDLDYASASALAGTIKDAAGNAAVSTLPQPNDPVEISLADNADLVVDTTAPSVGSVDSSPSTPNGAYKAGSEIYIEVHFNEAVYVTGTPTLRLETGSLDQQAEYQVGHGTSTLTFLYTVQAGDTSGDLNYRSTSALAGTIQDAATNAAVLTLPALSSTYSLGGGAAIIVDTTAPLLDSVTIDDGGDNQLAQGETAGLTISGEADIDYNLVLTNCSVAEGTSGKLLGGSVTLTLTALGNGGIVAQATLTDAAGNASASKSDTSTGTGF